jgi:hypothetical protein
MARREPTKPFPVADAAHEFMAGFSAMTVTSIAQHKTKFMFHHHGC